MQQRGKNSPRGPNPQLVFFEVDLEGTRYGMKSKKEMLITKNTFGVGFAAHRQGYRATQPFPIWK